MELALRVAGALGLTQAARARRHAPGARAGRCAVLAPRAHGPPELLWPKDLCTACGYFHAWPRPRMDLAWAIRP
jgi:hypothetical protein